jgi:hypothetical protein
MHNYEKKIEEIINSDPHGLLNIKSVSKSITSDQRLEESFLEIVNFYKAHKKEPQEVNEINERKLAIRLKELKKNPEKIKLLKNLDTDNLLGNPVEYKSVDDIIDNDFLGILNTDEYKELFDLKNVKFEKNKTDFIARRKPCSDFHKFENNFKKIHDDLKNKRRKLLTFKEQDLQEGRYFLLDGLLTFLEKVDLQERTFNDKSQGQRTRQDNRIRCIFENGLESNMYYRSLQKLLYENGKYISETNEEALNIFKKNLGNINKKDKISGRVYILKSLSKKAEICSIKNLYKIGFSKNTVENRIKNAKNDPTFLMDEVEIVDEINIYNVSALKFENLIQIFFAKRCLDIFVIDSHGNEVKPKEWFSIPLRVIKRAIQLIESEEIVNYIYDINLEDVVKIK